MWFALLKNPLTKIIAEKTFGAIQHKLQKDKIVREKELDAASQISIEQIKQQEHSWKDEAVLIILTLPILVIAWGVFSDDPNASQKIKEFFEQFQQLPSWFTNLWILVVASIYGIKGTQIFKGKK